MNTGIKKAESGRCEVALTETDAGDGTLSRKPQTRGNTQINGDGQV